MPNNKYSFCYYSFFSPKKKMRNETRKYYIIIFNKDCKASTKYGILFEDLQNIQCYCESKNEIKKHVENSCIFNGLLLVVFLSQGKRKTEMEK